MALWPVLSLESVNRTVSVIINMSQGYAFKSTLEFQGSLLFSMDFNSLICTSPFTNYQL